MCLILDTNKYGDFLTPENRDMEPVRKWMQTGNGKIAYSPTEKMQSELNRHSRMREQFDRYRETDKLKLVPSDKGRIPAPESSPYFHSFPSNPAFQAGSADF